MLRLQVVVDRQLVQVNSQPEWEPPKSAQSIRTVPRPVVTLGYVAEHMARFSPGDDGVIFTQHDGSWIRRSSFSVNRRAGLDRGSVRVHELRLYYASVLIGSGASAKVVQARIGR